MVDIPTASLAGDVRMPMVGLGTAGLVGDAGYSAMRHALDIGYRHLDTATAYDNEAEVGRALRDSGVAREAVFITTKLPPERAGDASAVLTKSLRALGVHQVDLWLIHWPPDGQACAPAWRALIAARESGAARAIGVSNYGIGQLDELAAATGVVPAVNQIPWSPARHDPAMLAAHRSRGIEVEGYSPLNGTDLDDPALTRIADAHGATTAQVVLSWHLTHGITVIPKSGSAERQRANFRAGELSLTDDEVRAVDRLAQ
ncbi:aldo/keto reductase [Actinoplanes sp. NPDC051633]|uniref:aldo/keto reductase n=1 Tax=Actinoplanes sp. NPDC051633 TaxID=3155670 RepID=UPI00344899F5